MNAAVPDAEEPPRRRYDLEETGFKEVPKKWRKFYRHWKGPDDALAPNEVMCPVCKVVIRSNREFRPGDRVYCMPRMTRMVLERGPNGALVAVVSY